MDQKFCRNRSILLCFRDKRVFAFTADIQDGCQKWRENNFGEKLPVDSADTLWVKNFVEITLSCSVSEINAFLHFMQKFKMADKSDGKIIFLGSCQKTADTPRVKNFVEIADTLRVKNFVEIALSHSISQINLFFVFSTKKNRDV